MNLEVPVTGRGAGKQRLMSCRGFPPRLAGDGPGALAGQSACLPFPPTADPARANWPSSARPGSPRLGTPIPPPPPPASSRFAPTLHPLRFRPVLPFTGLPDGEVSGVSSVRGRVSPWHLFNRPAGRQVWRQLPGRKAWRPVAVAAVMGWKRRRRSPAGGPIKCWCWKGPGPLAGRLAAAFLAKSSRSCLGSVHRTNGKQTTT